MGGDDNVARERETHAGAHGRAVHGGDDGETEAAQAHDQRIHETAHFECALPRFLGFEIYGVQVEPAAEHIVAAGDDDGLGAALAFLNLIERQMDGTNDGDVDCVAGRRTLQGERRHPVGNCKS